MNHSPNAYIRFTLCCSEVITDPPVKILCSICLRLPFAEKIFQANNDSSIRNNLLWKIMGVYKLHELILNKKERRTICLFTKARKYQYEMRVRRFVNFH